MVAVILDIGSRYVRIGPEGDLTPKISPILINKKASYIVKCAHRHLLPPDYGLHDVSLTKEKRDYLIGSFLTSPLHSKLSRIFTREQNILAACRNDQLSVQITELLESVLLTPSQCRGIIVEPANISNREKSEIATVLLSRLGLKSLCWLSEPIMESIAASSSDSLVIHLGWSSATITSIVDLRVISNKEIDQFSGQTLHYKLLEKLLELENGNLYSILDSAAGFGLIENFMQSALYVRDDFGSTEITESPSQNAPDFKLNEDVSIPDRIRHEVIELLIADVAAAALDFVSKCEIDARKRILDNIIVAGGISNIPGVKRYLLRQIRKAWKIANIYESLGSWSGASMYYSSLETEELKAMYKKGELTREQYLKIEAVAAAR